MTREWTSRDLSFLIENYCTMSIKEIALKLGRTKRAIESRARKLELKKNKKNFYADSRAYKAEEKVKEKIKNFTIVLNKNDMITIKTKRFSNKKKTKTLKGRVVFNNKNYFTLQCKNYKESFLKSDIFTGLVEIQG